MGWIQEINEVVGCVMSRTIPVARAVREITHPTGGDGEGWAGVNCGAATRCLVFP